MSESHHFGGSKPVFRAARGGRAGYLLSRVFAPYAKLKRYYPILEKYRWLMPVMQIRRWLMLLRPDIAKMAQSEIVLNQTIDSSQSAQITELLEEIGL